MIQLWSNDNAALVLARVILKQEPKSSLQIFLGESAPKGAFLASDIWKEALETSLKKYTRLGVAFDGSNDEEALFVRKAGEKVFPVEHELLSGFSNRRLADTVEFRRLARKYLRPVRNAHCDGILFLSGVLAEETSCKILAKITGTQVETVFVSDFLPKELFMATTKQSIEIFTDQDIERVHEEAERFLHTKLAKGVVVLQKEK